MGPEETHNVYFLPGWPGETMREDRFAIRVENQEEYDALRDAFQHSNFADATWSSGKEIASDYKPVGLNFPILMYMNTEFFGGFTFGYPYNHMEDQNRPPVSVAEYCAMLATANSFNETDIETLL